MALIPATAMLTAALVLVIVRLLCGAHTVDRAIALDMLGLVGVALGGLTAVFAVNSAYLDVGLGLALFGFLGAVALALLIERSARGQGRA